MKTALITGITGQDGAYLTEFLLQKNYHVIGFQQLSATPNTQNISHLIDKNNFELIHGDITDAHNITHILSKFKPDEIYNLAGQSHVGVSFDIPAYTTQVKSMRVLDLRNTRLYQASTSEIFGNSGKDIQNEKAPFAPASPYAAAKLYAHHMVGVYRESYGLHASCGILFNHESPIRGEEFVTRKITKAVAQIHRGEPDILKLGNLSAKRDWGHARDYVRGMWLMLQQNTHDDYVLATGQSHSVREFLTRAFKHIGTDIIFKGEGLDEVGYDAETEDVLVAIDPQLYRPNEVHHLCGDATKAYKKLGWKSEISFDELIREMVESDLNA